MIDDPKVKLSAVLDRGATFMRTYTLGDAATAGFNPADYTARAVLLSCRDEAVVGEIQMARLTKEDGSVDDYNYAFVVSRDIVGSLDRRLQYLGTVDFDKRDDPSITLRHGVVAFTVGMGAPR